MENKTVGAPGRDKALLMTLRLTLYPLLIVLFFACMRLGNPYLIAINRTLATTLLAITAALGVFSHVYGGFRIGELKRSSVTINMWMSVFLSDGFAYLILQIMNVNARNKRRLDLVDDLSFLILALLLQFLLIALYVWYADRLYRRLNPPKKCCVITDTDASYNQILPKLKACAGWFYPSEHALVDDPAVYDAIQRSECCVLFHLPLEAHHRLMEYCYRYQKPVYFDIHLGDIVVRDSEQLFVDDVLMGMHHRGGLTIRQRIIKRAMDIVISFLMIVVLSPVMLACAIAIAVEDGKPIIYKQKRVTRGNRIFTIYKFRTMRNDADAVERSVTRDDDRITRVGARLRRFRLDELPQLFNILLGDMSLVGPRPEMLTNVEEYTRDLPEFGYRSQVKAGLTGYAQIMGKYNTPPREKLMMDMSYIDNYSLWMDIKLLFKTVLAVLRPESTEAFDDRDVKGDR